MATGLQPIDVDAGDGIGLALTALAYVGTVIATARSIRAEADLSDRERLWGTALVVVLPVVGILLWVVVSPDRAWRIFNRPQSDQPDQAAAASRRPGR